MVKGPGNSRIFLSWVHGDRDFHGGGVTIDPAVLQLSFFIDTPTGLAGNAKAGMIQHDNEFAASCKMVGSVLHCSLWLTHILECENNGSMRKIRFGLRN